MSRDIVTGNCGNRQHVAAYRERRATDARLRDEATDQRLRQTTSFNAAQDEGF